MKDLKILFVLLLCISCQGQEKNEKKISKPEVKVNAEKEFKKQKNRFEIIGYKLFYNNINLKSDTIQSIFKILGKPKGEDLAMFYYENLPFTLSNKVVYDNPGKSYNERKRVITKTGETLQIVRKYRIIFKKHKPSYIPSKRDSLLMQIPTVDGFVKINGFYIDKNTKREELVAKLKPTIKNADFFNSRGTISTWYHATENNEPLTKFDPRIRTAFDGYIRIDYAYFDEELYAIDYYYDIFE